jgi:hypothetical protein
MKRARGRFVDGLDRAKHKGTRKRWTNGKRRQIYEEDSQHGDLEKYNRRGQHKGTVNPDTGEIIKEPVKGRTTEV